MTTKIKFKPWIGRNHEDGMAGKRILVLGESHYCEDPSNPDKELTLNVFKYLFDENNSFEYYMNTYTKFERALLGKAVPFHDKDGKRKIWDNVIFYNYVQAPMPGPRVKPTYENFRESEAAFFEILNTHKPERVIAWGRRLYDELPGEGHEIGYLTDHTGEKHRIWGYTLDNGEVVEVMGCTHPSAAFSWTYWHKVFELFFNN